MPVAASLQGTILPGGVCFLRKGDLVDDHRPRMEASKGQPWTMLLSSAAMVSKL